MPGLMLHRLSYAYFAWSMACIFLLHNLEEGITMYDWLQMNTHLIPPVFQPKLAQLIQSTVLQETVYISLLLATLVPFLLVYLAHRQHYRSISFNLLIIVCWIMLLNALQHIASSLILVSYTPGVVTAVSINLPFSWLFLHRTLHDTHISRQETWLLLPAAILLYLVSLPGIWLLSWGLVNLVA